MANLPTLYEHYTQGGVAAGLSDAQPHFTLNNKNITLYSGAMHYFRVPPGHWRDRLRKMRAAGLNAVETYVPWNLHEPEPGAFDFGQGGTDFQELLDIEKFLKTAQEEDLFAIVRPGPYICSEWEFGGLPSWLLREKGIRVRTSDEKYIEPAKRFLAALFSILTALQFTKGGPIIAFQIENEYGSVSNNDPKYLEILKKAYEDNGLVELFFTSDGASMGKTGMVPGVLYTANFQGNAKHELTIAQSYQPGKPSMAMEYWTGWFDHWTEQHHTRSTRDFRKVLIDILEFPASVNMYMFHGGTSFGFTNGANIGDGSTDNKGYQPDTNSYDYDSPLSEPGDYTDKYEAVVKVLERYNQVPTKLPPRPALVPRVAYPEVEITHELPFQDVLQQAEHHLQSSILLPMELLPINNNAGQSYGYIVYRKKNVNIPVRSKLKILGRVCDTAMVFVNGQLMTKIPRTQSDLQGFGYWHVKDAALYLGDEAHIDATLDIVVENWGRNNFGQLAQFVQHKGLWQGNVTLNDEHLQDFEIIPLEFKKKWTNGLTGWKQPTFQEGPALYKGVLTVEDPQDTFVDMSEWNKGIVIVNGFVLSRHFRIGPQQAAYLPGPFLHRGDNEIVVFEHFQPSMRIKFSKDQIYNTLD